MGRQRNQAVINEIIEAVSEYQPIKIAELARVLNRTYRQVHWNVNTADEGPIKYLYEDDKGYLFTCEPQVPSRCRESSRLLCAPIAQKRTFRE